jgi:hypothetical protein
VTFRRLLVLLALIILLLLLKPRWLWRELNRIWSQRETIIRLLMIVIAVYLLYGVYTIWMGEIF